MAVSKSSIGPRRTALRQRIRSHDNLDEYRHGMRLIHAFALFQPSFFLITAAATAAALWAGQTSVNAGAAQVGAVVAAIGYIELVFAPIRQLAEKFNVFNQPSRPVERVEVVLDADVEEDDGTVVPPAGQGPYVLKTSGLPTRATMKKAATNRAGSYVTLMSPFHLETGCVGWLIGRR